MENNKVLKLPLSAALWYVIGMLIVLLLWQLYNMDWSFASLLAILSLPFIILINMVGGGFVPFYVALFLVLLAFKIVDNRNKWPVILAIGVIIVLQFFIDFVISQLLIESFDLNHNNQVFWVSSFQWLKTLIIIAMIYGVCWLLTRFNFVEKSDFLLSDDCYYRITIIGFGLLVIGISTRSVMVILEYLMEEYWNYFDIGRHRYIIPMVVSVFYLLGSIYFMFWADYVFKGRIFSFSANKIIVGSILAYLLNIFYSIVPLGLAYAVFYALDKFHNVDIVLTINGVILLVAAILAWVLLTKGNGNIYKIWMLLTYGLIGIMWFQVYSSVPYYIVGRFIVTLSIMGGVTFYMIMSFWVSYLATYHAIKIVWKDE